MRPTSSSGIFIAGFILIFWATITPTAAVTPTKGQGLASTAAPPVRLLDGNDRSGKIPACIPRSATDIFDQMQREHRRMVPDDCQTTGLAPPMFIWTEPRNVIGKNPSGLLRNLSKPFEITVTRTGVGVIANQKTVRSAATFSSNDAAWTAGDYSWTIAFIAKSGARIESAARRFRILPGAVALDWPDGITFAATVAARPFPRPLPSGQTFASLKRKIDAGEHALPWARFEALTRTYLSTSAFPLPIYPLQIDKYQRGSPESIDAGLAWQSPIQNEHRIIQALAYTYCFTSDIRLRDAALIRLENLANWSLTGATVTDTDLDLVNRSIYRALAEGLDLLWDDIAPPQRTAWIHAIRVRMQAILKAFDNYDTQPYQSHLVGETAIALETLMHVAGMPGFPEAQSYLAETWERFRFGFNVWGGEDGGFGNGIAYGWYSIENLPSTLAAVRVMAGVDIARHPYIQGLGNYLMAFVPPVMKAPGMFSPFGDGVETTSFFAWYAPEYFRLLSALVRDSGQEWFWRANPNSQGAKVSGKLSPWHFMLLGLSLPAVESRQPTATAYVSDDAGVGAIFSKMSDPARSALYLRSSRFGSVSHEHADQNSIAFDSHGQKMLISSGYYPWYGSNHHFGVTRLTRFKNALTFDGGIGQNETVVNPALAPIRPGLTDFSMDNRGEIINFFNGLRWGVVTGDASNAYRPRQRDFPHSYGAALVDVALRSAAYDRYERIAVLYDHAKSMTPRRWELNFHGLSPFQENGSGMKLTRNGTELCIDIHGADGKFENSQGFPIRPELDYPSEQYPEQYHSRFVVNRPDTHLTTVTILREDCSNTRVTVNFTGPRATVTIANGLPIVFDRHQVIVPDQAH